MAPAPYGIRERSSRSRRPEGSGAPQLQGRLGKTAHSRMGVSSTSRVRSTARPLSGDTILKEPSSRSRDPAGELLYSFKGSGDGVARWRPVNVKGTLYGTTFHGGANGPGTVFSITPSGRKRCSTASRARAAHTRLRDSSTSRARSTARPIKGARSCRTLATVRSSRYRRERLRLKHHKTRLAAQPFIESGGTADEKL